ncbi:hypothetical protein ACFFNY_06895 [Paenibacillus hodogayensis]|uniref:ATPase BadF/BadG/BcrA/BcrD type domain-containing protein n=1 Tax=Paenibacillus hodogayensis TaxID=279208 RepID=A0ABV5VSQ3_9BACL
MGVFSLTEGGASSIHKDGNAAENVRSAIRSALANAGCRPGAVKGLCAGVAGYDSERDLEWVETLTAVEGSAHGGSRLALLVCDRAIDQIVVGVEMLGSCFQSDRVAVAGIGSVINSPYMKSALAAKLEHGQNKQYCLADAALSAVSGVVVMALKHVRAPIGPETFREIGKYPRSVY